MGKFLTLLAMLVLSSVLVIAQTKVITGRVTDPQGQPVAFASIKIKGQRQGVPADADGNFTIKAKPGDALSVSGTGYQTKDIIVGETASLNIQLIRNNSSLTEVVVTALGQTQNKAKIGYATQTFNTAAINRNGAVSLLDGLEGKVAGAEISNTGGPGSSTKVILRGVGAISGGDNQPLYVIDGVPMSNAGFQGGGMGTDGADYGTGLNNINPNDIESLTILKGTAASSLYGGLGKNGAIMITTKRGRAGKLKIDYNGSLNFSQVGKLPDYQNEFGQGWAGVFVLDENGSWGPRLDGKPRLWGSVVDNSQLLKPFSAIKNNVRSFYTTGTEVSNSLSLSGGTETNRFYFSYGNTESDGVVPTRSDYLQRNTFALRTNSTFDAFSINTSFNYTNQSLSVPNTGQGTASGGGVFQSLLQIPVDIPIKDFRDYNNKFFNTDNFFTPYAENPYFGLNENGNNQKLDRIFGNLDLGYKFSSHLSTQFRLGGDFTNARTFEWKQPAAPKPGSWVGPNPTNPEGATKTPDVGQVTQGSDYNSIINGDFIVKYNTDLGSNFGLDALVGANYYQSTGRSEATTVTNLTVPSFFNLSNTSKPPTTADAYGRQRRIGAYVQATFSYKDLVYLTGNVREDKSSTLPLSANSIFYPGANASWVISNMMDARNTLSYLKVRAGYGRTGSDPQAYLTNSSLANGATGLGFGSLTFPFNGVAGFRVSNQIANANLKPIFTDEVEGGVEAKFLKDRIGLDVTVYDRVTKGQIFAVPIGAGTGYTSIVQNLGQVSNKGIELTLNVKPVMTKDFTWSLTYLFTRNWNNVDNLNGNPTQNPVILSEYAAEQRAVVGKTVASIYAPVAQKTPDGKTVVDATTGFPTLNQTPLDKYGLTNGYYGSGLYTYTMGLTNQFEYKGFVLSASLDFRYGGVMYSQTADMVLFTGNSKATTYNDRKPFVVPNSVNQSGLDGSGKPTYVENKTFIGATAAGQADNSWGYYYPTQNQGSSYQFRIFDKSFLKLRDINLSYRLPSAWYSKIKATYASFGVYARNILLWTPKANIYVDPEQTNLGNDVGSYLGEFASSPLSKQFGAIIKISF
jgi:TonB-linked SusC/RagA family outer membrane protein